VRKSPEVPGSRETYAAFVRERVRQYFVAGEDNCAMTALKILSEHFALPLDAQVVAAGWYVPGAGGVGEVCGLVMGVLMFLGVWADRHYARREIPKPLVQRTVARVHHRFGSLCCRDLQREEGCGSLAVALFLDLLPFLDEALGASQTAGAESGGM